MSFLMSRLADLIHAHQDALPAAIASFTALAAVAASLLTWVRSRAWIAKLERRHAEQAGITADTVSSLRTTITTLTSQLEELRRAPPASAPALPRPAFNLSKRSQALRLYRHGEPPEQIASALELPKQEVDLLLKVHRIIIRNL